MHEAITKYVYVDKELIHKDKKVILDFYRANFFINGLRMSYDELRYDSNYNEWIKLDNKKDLELFEQIIAVGYEAGVFHESISLKWIECNALSRQELKYSLPEEFEYLDYEYYQGLNDGIIKKNGVYIDLPYYEDVERTCTKKELLKYWFTDKNIPDAYELCEPFQYMLENNIEELLNVATFLFINGSGPISLLFELNKNTNTNLLLKINYLMKTLDEESLQNFSYDKEMFLKVMEVQYKSNIIQKKKRLK